MIIQYKANDDVHCLPLIHGSYSSFWGRRQPIVYFLTRSYILTKFIQHRFEENRNLIFRLSVSHLFWAIKKIGMLQNITHAYSLKTFPLGNTPKPKFSTGNNAIFRLFKTFCILCEGFATQAAFTMNRPSGINTNSILIVLTICMAS